MALVAAISQPSLRLDRTGTFGQSLFCTTAVGASTKVPEGEYSMRTSDAVRNSKRAFPTTSVGLLSVLAQHIRNAGARPMNSLFAVEPVMPGKRIRGACSVGGYGA